MGLGTFVDSLCYTIIGVCILMPALAHAQRLAI